MDQFTFVAMKEIFSKFNVNWIAVFILLGAFILSAVRFSLLETSSLDEWEDGAKVIRVAHSQLEPGFREALELVMGEYNQLPHVQEAGFEWNRMQSQSASMRSS